MADQLEQARQGPGRAPEGDAARGGGADALAPTVSATADDGVAAEPPVGASRRFGPGRLVGGRYRVVRFIAAGGMGEVYEAQDLELRGRVALKTVRADRASPRAIERLKRELQLARQVRHVNVCHLYDVGFHDEPGEPREVFLTMELLGGETLAQRIERTGPLPPGEALRVLRQVAAGLDAAHGLGIVHRDLKPENVFVVPSAATDGGVRVVITDFGVARGADAGHGFGPATQEGAVVGTPRYMAPEQRLGDVVTAASDRYAFGLVMYEILKGRRAGGAITSELDRAPEDTRGLRVAGVDRRWAAVIHRLLSLDPDERFGSALEAVDAIDPRRQEPARRSTSWQGAGLALVAAAVVLAVGVPRLSARRPTAPRATRLVVLPPRNLSGRPEAAWVAAAVPEMLRSELSAGGLSVVPGEAVLRARADLGLADADSLGVEGLGRLHAQLGADLVVAGAYLALPDPSTIRLDLRLQEAEGGDLLAAPTATGPQAQLPSLVAAVGRELREAVPVDAQGGLGPRAPPPAPEVEALYQRGIDRLRALDAVAARARFEEAIARQPGWAPAHRGLALALDGAGQAAAARQEAQRAFEGSAGLPRQQRLLIEATYRWSRGEWDQALERYRSLSALFPDQSEALLGLGEAQLALERFAEADETIAALRRLPIGAAGDPRIDLLAAEGHHYELRDPRAGLEAAERALAQGVAKGSPMVQSLARRAEAAIAWDLGEPRRALAAAGASLEAAREADNPGAVLAAQLLEARLRGLRGPPSDGIRAGEQGLRQLRDAGDIRELPWTLGGQAELLLRAGRVAEGRALAAEALRLGREQGDTAVIWSALIVASTIEARAGGRLEEARKNLTAAVAASATVPRRRVLALCRLGEVLREMDEGGAASSRLLEAEALAERSGLPLLAAEAKLGRAEILMGAGDAEGALPAARGAVEALAAAGLAEDEARARAVLARALLSRGEVAAARRALGALAANARPVEDRAAALALDIARARLLARSGSDGRRRASELLAARAEAAGAQGLVADRLRARLAAASIERAASVRGAAERAEAVAVEAAALGYLAVARQARALAAH